VPSQKAGVAGEDQKTVVDQKQISKDIYRLMIPVILENILQMSAGLVTAAMVGRLLPVDISAQGIGMRIYQINWAFFKGITMGATVVIAISYGAGRLNRCKHLVQQSFLTAVPLGLLFAAVTFFLRVPIAGFMTDEAELVTKSAEFLRIAAWSFPFSGICCMTTAAFNGHGNTKTPMYIAGLINAVNIVAGYLLIFGAFGFPRLGLTGAAIATLLSQMAGAIAGLLLLFHPKRGFFAGVGAEYPFLHFDRRGVWEIYTTGVPASVENLFWQFSAVLISKIILSYGSVYFAAYQMGLQAESIAEMPAMGFVTAATTLSATAIGRLDDPLFKAYRKQMVKIATLFSLCSGVGLLLCAKPFMYLLTNNPEVQAIGFWYVFFMGFAQLPQNVSKIYNGVIRSAGYKNAPMAITFLGIWVIRVPLCILIGWVLHWNILWIWAAIVLDQTTRYLISMALYHIRKVDDTVLVLKAREAQA